MTFQDAPTVQGATTRRYKPVSVEDLTETVRVTPEQLSFALNIDDDFGTIEPEAEVVEMTRPKNAAASSRLWMWAALFAGSSGLVGAFFYFS